MSMLSRLAAMGAQAAGGTTVLPIQFVGSYSVDMGSIASGTITFGGNLTGGLASSPAQNDFVLVILGASTTADTDYGTSSSGWTEAADLFANASSSDANLALFYKRMGATPDTSITVTASTATFTQALVYVLRNVDKTTAIDIAQTTATATGSANPNPPAISPATYGAAVISIGVGAGSGSVAAFTSSDLSNFVAAGGGFARIGCGAIYNWSGGAVDPAAFGGGQTAGGISWAAVTLSLRPAMFGRPLPSYISGSFGRAASTSVTVTAPSGIQNGDLLVALSYVGSTVTVTPPSGFSQIYADQVSNPGTTISVKTAQAESGNYTFTLSSSSNVTVAILVYRNATAVNAISGVNRPGTSSATATAPSITPTYTGVLVAAFTNSSGTSTIATPPAGMTQRIANEGTSNPPNLTVYDLPKQDAGASGSKALVWSSSNTVSGLTLQITNEPDIEPDFISTASTQTTVNGADLTINTPSGTANGDLMIALLSSETTTTGRTWTPPAGWSEVADLNDATGLCFAYKNATGSEPASHTFVNAIATNRLSGSILTFRYAAYDAIGSFITGANPLSLPSISPSASQSIVIAAAARAAASVTLGIPPGMTARVTDNDATPPSYIVCTQGVAKGPTGTRSISTGSTTNVAGIMLAIKPTRSLT